MAKRSKQEDRRARARRRRSSGLICQLCGDGPYAKLTAHMIPIHGLNRTAYLRLFPGADMTIPEERAAWRQELLDLGSGTERQTHCAKGHPLRGNNVRRNGAKRRVCRICNNAKALKLYHERAAASGTKLCECGCGTQIPKKNGRGVPRRFVHGHHNRKLKTRL